jgi:hypothetical protein
MGMPLATLRYLTPLHPVLIFVQSGVGSSSETSALNKSIHRSSVMHNTVYYTCDWFRRSFRTITIDGADYATSRT